MNEERNTAEFTRQTVLNFRFLDAKAMGALRTDLGLSLSDAALFRCREHFRLREGRDPTVRELLFLNAYTRMRYALPTAVRVKEVSGSAEDVRIFADMKKKQAVLQREGVTWGDTLCELMGLTGEYLSRCGAPPHHPRFACGHVHEITARTAKAAQGGADTAAAILPPAVRNPYARNVLLLAPTGSEPFADEILRLTALCGTGVEILAAPCGEGLMPHLLSLNCGLMLDTLPLPCHAPEVDPSAVLTAGKGALLLLATDEAMPYLLSRGLPLIAFGFTQPGDRIILRHGNEITLSLSHELLSLLHAAPSVSLSLPPRAPVPAVPAVALRNGCLWGQVTAQGGCERALLDLIGEMRAQGGDPRRITLTAALETPPEVDGHAALSELMLSVLDHHRVCAELALPTVNHRLLVQDGLAAPRITLYAVAEQTAPEGADFAPRWQDACAARDFAALRALLYLTN